MSGDAWRESATTDVLFPDDLEGYGPISVVGEPIDAEDTDTDTVEHGTVAALEADHHEATYVVAPQQLRKAIGKAWRPDEDRAVLEVLEAEKAGDEEHSAWEIETRVLENGDPL